MTQDPIAPAMRQWIAVNLAILEGRPLPTPFGTFLRSGGELKKRVGERGLEQVKTRVVGALAEILEGAPAPPVARMDLDGYTAVEADLAAEKLVDEYRRRGVKHNPEWRAELTRKFDLQVARYTEKVQARYAKPKPQPQPEPLQRVTLPAQVTAQTRTAPTTYYVGTWEAGATYNRGAMVTDKGKLWHCEKDGTCERPGGSPAFKMMHK